jgi:hypothetical protein
MNLQKIFVPVVVVVLVAGAWRAAGWTGIALVASGLVMWALLHFNRLMRVLKRSADRPVGYVGSAVMLNAKLKPGVNLLHVMALTDSLGERLSAEGEQPEVFRWTDGGASSVTAEFANGKLVKWALSRPAAPPEQPESAGN